MNLLSLKIENGKLNGRETKGKKILANCCLREMGIVVGVELRSAGKKKRKVKQGEDEKQLNKICRELSGLSYPLLKSSTGVY